MELHLKIIGILLMLLALIHVFFPGYFKWKTEFSVVSVINRQMMYVHTFFIALTVFLIGLLCFSSSSEMVSTNLGRKISFGLCVFCFTRLVIQFVGYSPALWKGKAFETTVHILFVVLWAYLSGVFLMVYIDHGLIYTHTAKPASCCLYFFGAGEAILQSVPKV